MPTNQSLWLCDLKYRTTDEIRWVRVNNSVRYSEKPLPGQQRLYTKTLSSTTARFRPFVAYNLKLSGPAIARYFQICNPVMIFIVYSSQR